MAGRRKQSTRLRKERAFSSFTFGSDASEILHSYSIVTCLHLAINRTSLLCIKRQPCGVLSGPRRMNRGTNVKDPGECRRGVIRTIGTRTPCIHPCLCGKLAAQSRSLPCANYFLF